MSVHDTHISEDDHVLFSLIAEGDEVAFRRLFHRYIPRFLPVVVDMIKMEGAAKDVVQEVFLRVWLSRDKLGEIKDPRAWLFRIVYYQCYTWLRKKGIRDRAQDILLKNALEEPSGNSVEETVTVEETGRLIREAVQQLSPQAGKIYGLSREEGLKVAEIADLLNISEQTVKNTLSRALKSIKEYLEQNGVSLPFILLWYWLK